MLATSQSDSLPSVYIIKFQCQATCHELDTA